MKIILSIFLTIWLLPILSFGQEQKILTFKSDPKFGEINTKIKKSEGPVFIYVEPSLVNDFTDKLSELGKRGYKLKFAERYTLDSKIKEFSQIKISGIAELHEGDFYEYRSLETMTLDDLSDQWSPLAKEGFYVNGHIRYSLAPDHNIPSVTAAPGTPERDIESIERSTAIIKQALSTDPVDGNVFILERKNKNTEPVEFKFATITPGKSIWGTSMLDLRKVKDSVESSIGEIDTKRFYPISAFYSSAVFRNRVSHIPTVLFQNKPENDNYAKPNYKASSAGGLNFQRQKSFKKDMDLITRTGFAAVVATSNFALTVETGRPVSYNWVETNKKDFFQTITEISRDGARYVINLTNPTFMDFSDLTSLVFEKPLIDDGKRFEYKILKLTEKPRSVKNKENKREILMETSEEAKQSFQELLNQGFVIRGLFYGGGKTNGMNVIFERQISP